MSIEIAEKRRKEIEKLEEEDARILREMETDTCPLCGKFTKDFEYLVMLPPPFGWIECPGCGNVFCPSSLRKKKLHKRVESDNIIVT